MKITLRSCPIIWVQYFRSWFVFSSTIFMWYLQEQVAFKVKLSKGTKGEFPAELPQVITWSWNVAALNSPSILFKESKTCVDISSLLTTSNLFLLKHAYFAYIAYQNSKLVTIPAWSYHDHSKDRFHTSAYSTYEMTRSKHFLSKPAYFAYFAYQNSKSVTIPAWS